jgi:hypothetical protein
MKKIQYARLHDQETRSNVDVKKKKTAFYVRYILNFAKLLILEFLLTYLFLKYQ